MNENEDLIQIGDNIYVLTWDKPEREIYRYRVQNSKGQTIELSIWLFHQNETNDKYYYAISLSVNKKSKGYEFGKETGKAGIESLLIAKKMLKYHIDKFIDNIYSTKEKSYYFVIWWDDNRRRDVYYRGLKDLGFTFGSSHIDGINRGKCLFKQIIVNKL